MENFSNRQKDSTGKPIANSAMARQLTRTRHKSRGKSVRFSAYGPKRGIKPESIAAIQARKKHETPSVADSSSRNSRSRSKHARLQRNRPARSTRKSNVFEARGNDQGLVEKQIKSNRASVQVYEVLPSQPGIKFPWRRAHKGESLDQLHQSGFFERVPLPKKKLVRTPAALVVTTKRSSQRPGSMILTPTEFYHKTNLGREGHFTETRRSQLWVTAAILNSLRDESPLESASEQQETTWTEFVARAGPHQHDLHKLQGINEDEYVDGEPDEGKATGDTTPEKVESRGSVSTMASECSQWPLVPDNQKTIEEAVRLQGAKISPAPYRHGSIQLDRGSSIASSRAASVVGLDAWTTFLPNEERESRDDAVIEDILQFFEASSDRAAAMPSPAPSRGGMNEAPSSRKAGRPESAPVLNASLMTQSHAAKDGGSSAKTIGKTASLPLRLGSHLSTRPFHLRRSQASNGSEGSGNARPSSLASLLSWKRGFFNR